MKKWLVAIIAVIGLFALNQAKADTILNQNQTDFSRAGMIAAQTFVVPSSTIGTITMEGGCFGGGSCQGFGELYGILSPTGLTPSSLSTSSMVFLASSTNTYNITGGDQTIDFNFDNVSLSGYVGYAFLTYQTASSSGGQTQLDGYHDVIAGSAYNNLAIMPNEDLYIVINTAVAPTNAVNLYFNFPSNTQHIYQDFTSYSLSVFSNSTSTGKIDIFLSAATSSLLAFNKQTYPVGGFTIFNSGWTNLFITKDTAIGYGDYFLQAVFYDENNIAIATSSIITFQYHSPGQIALPNGLLFQLEVCGTYSYLGFSIDDPFCNIRNTFREIGNELQSIVSNSASFVGNLLIQIFPLNIFHHINNDITQAQASTTPDIALSVAFHSDLHDKIDLFNSSTEAQVSSKFGIDIRGILTKIMYIVTFLYIAFMSWLVINHMKNKHNIKR